MYAQPPTDKPTTTKNPPTTMAATIELAAKIRNEELTTSTIIFSFVQS